MTFVRIAPPTLVIILSRLMYADVIARDRTGEECERWYARGIDIYPGWTHYRKGAPHRRIPVIELTPADG